MLEEATDKLQGVESDLTRPVAALLAIRKSDVPIFDSHDSGVGDSHPEDIRSKVLQGGSAVAYGLTVDVPVHLPDRGIDFVHEFPFRHLVFELGLKDLGKGSDGQIEVIAGCQPHLSVRGYASGGDNEMQMGMVLHLSPPGMEDGGKARQIGADESGVFSQYFDGA